MDSDHRVYVLLSVLGERIPWVARHYVQELSYGLAYNDAGLSSIKSPV